MLRLALTTLPIIADSNLYNHRPRAQLRVQGMNFVLIWSRRLFLTRGNQISSLFSYLCCAFHYMSDESERPSVTDLLLRRFLYHMWRMDEAARSYAHLKDHPDKENMRNRWEIGITYELVSAQTHGT